MGTQPLPHSLYRSRFAAFSLKVGTIVTLTASAVHAAPREDSKEPPANEPGANETTANEPPANEPPATKAPTKEPPANEPPALDDITLRDGSRLRGRVIEKEPGRWIVVETEDGRYRTFAWDVVQSVDLAAGIREPWVPEPVRRAWLSRGGWDVSYEIRAELTAIVLPSKTYSLTGFCASGTGIAPASIYGQTASDRAQAVGGGLGGRASYMHILSPEPETSSSFWAIRVGSGLDFQLLHTRNPEGLRPIDGELCTQVARTSHEVEATSKPALLIQIPFNIGVHLGLGKFSDLTVWRGVVLGAAWSPSFVHLGPWSASGSSYFNPLGVELTVDFTSLHAVPESRRPESHTRVSASFAAPAGDSPLITTIAFGVVWY